MLFNHIQLFHIYVYYFQYNLHILSVTFLMGLTMFIATNSQNILKHNGFETLILILNHILFQCFTLMEEKLSTLIMTNFFERQDSQKSLSRRPPHSINRLTLLALIFNFIPKPNQTMKTFIAKSKILLCQQSSPTM